MNGNDFISPKKFSDDIFITLVKAGYADEGCLPKDYDNNKSKVDNEPKPQQTENAQLILQQTTPSENTALTLPQSVQYVPNMNPSSGMQYIPDLQVPSVVDTDKNKNTITYDPDIYDILDGGIPCLYMLKREYSEIKKVQQEQGKKPKYRRNRSFDYDRIILAYICIDSSKDCGDCYKVELRYKDEKGVYNKTVVIPKKVCDDDNICHYLKRNGIKCFIPTRSDKEVSQCIYKLISRKSEQGDIIPVLSGFFQYEGSTVFVSDEFCEKQNIPYVGVSFNIESNCTNKEAVNNMLWLANKHTDIKKFILLNTIRITGLITSVLLELGIKFPKIIVIKGNASDINLYLQIYDRDNKFNEIKSINDSPLKFPAHFIGKDDVKLFIDDNPETDHKMGNGIVNIRAMSEMLFSQIEFEQRDKQAAYPVIGCVVSDKLAQYLSGKEVISIDMQNILPDCDRRHIMHTLYETDKLLVKDIIGNKGYILELLINHYEKYIQRLNFKYKETNIAFAILMTSFNMLIHIIRDYGEFNLCTKEFEEYVYDILEKSEKIDDINTIVSEFRTKLNELIVAGDLIVLENPNISSGIELPNGKPVAYLSDGFLLFTDDIFDNITEMLSLTNSSCNLRKNLKDNNSLKMNDDLKYKVTLPNIGRISVTAVKSAILTAESFGHIKGGDRNFTPCANDGKIARIAVGNDKNGIPVYWSLGHKELPSRHLMIMGNTGSGKSFAMNLIAKELFKSHYNIVYVNFKQEDVKAELAEHGLGYDFVNQNVSDYDIHDVNSGEFSLDDIFMENSYTDEADKIHFSKIIAFTTAGYTDEVETLLSNLYNHVSNNRKFDIILVIDEVHQLEFKKNAPINKIMSMGRGIGISLMFAFQGLYQMKSTQRNLLCQAPVKLLFRMSANDMKEAAQMISSSGYYNYVNFFKGLQKKQCVMIGALEDINGNIEECRFVQVYIPEIGQDQQ